MGDAWYSFDDIAKHTYALDVPAELSQLKFRDVYSMGLPVLIPDDPWMAQLLRFMYKSWGQIHAEVGDRHLPDATAMDREAPVHADDIDAVQAATKTWPHPPFYDPSRDPPSRLMYWLSLADFKRYPHVVRFSSLPTLLELVVTTRWAEVSVRMRAHFRRVVANVQRFFQQALTKLVLAYDKRALRESNSENHNCFVDVK